MKDGLCTDANLRHRPMLLAELEKNVACLTGTTAVRLTDEGLVCMTKDGEVMLPAETVILAAGRASNRAVYDTLCNAAPFVETIGDCVKPGNVAQAVFRGHFAALDI